MRGILPIKQKRVTHRRLLYCFDWTVIFLSALIGGLLYGFVPARQHLFRLDDPEISYPYHPDIIPTWSLFVICWVLPFIVLSLIAVFVVRSKHDFHHAAMGLCQTIALILVTTAVVKIFLGGLRPHFLVRCAPDVLNVPVTAQHGYDGRYYDTSVCTNPNKAELNDAQAAFPSGHAALAAGGLNYLSLYMNGKFKVFQHQGHLLVYILIAACTFGSVLVGFTRVVDFHHTFYNVMMGWTMGFLVALSMYRLNYVSLFGALNHVPVADTWNTEGRQYLLEEYRNKILTSPEAQNADISHLIDGEEQDEVSPATSLTSEVQ